MPTSGSADPLSGMSMYQEEKPSKGLPFEGGKKKMTPVTDKSGAVHSSFSRARHLARMALKSAEKKSQSKVNETKSAPKGFHFTKDGKLKRGDADVDGPGGNKLRSDPLDKLRNKIPAVSEAVKMTDKEKIDELKKSTLASYVMKAADSAKSKKDAAANMYRFTKQVTSAMKKSTEGDKRIEGIKSATKRLANVDEAYSLPSASQSDHDHVKKQLSSVLGVSSSENEKSSVPAVHKAIKKVSGISDTSTRKMSKAILKSLVQKHKIIVDKEHRQLLNQEAVAVTAPSVMAPKKSDDHQNFYNFVSAKLKMGKPISSKEKDFVRAYKLMKKVQANEDLDQIDELKKSTLTNYIRQSAPDIALRSTDKAAAAARSSVAGMSGDEKNKEKAEQERAAAHRRIVNRSVGIMKAARKIGEESMGAITLKSFRQQMAEKTLTPAEMKKREEVAKAIERENPKMPMGMKMAIATKTAKRVAEEMDDEGSMARGQLMQMVSQASMLARMMNDDRQLDGWVQSKLTKASDYLDSVHDYLMHNQQDVDKMDEAPEGQHYCAKHVYSEMFGEGVVLEGQHDEPNQNGEIEWYMVEFKDGIHKVYSEDVEIMIAEYHANHRRKKRNSDSMM